MEGDSNAIILPAKRSNKRKGLNQCKEHKRVKKHSSPKMSKSQEKKLKKLQEDEERALLLSKSIETLEKYKIPEDAFSLLRSSKNISRMETMREKRRMAIQFSRAGLEVLHDDQHFRSTSGNASCETETETEAESERIQFRQDIYKNNHFQPATLESQFPNNMPFTLATYQEQASGNELGLNESSVSGLTTEKVVKEGREDEKSVTDVSKAVNLPDLPLQRPVTTPTVVHVLRPDEVEQKRKDLPIIMMEQEIMEAVNEHSTVIICGETGCGKTTQVPQFLYEAGFGSNLSDARRGVIGVTQPRRVAVLATARRVAFELGLHLGKEVGFQVRHDKRIGENGSIKFMTDGILLREVQGDILLKRYSVIILDEAHERSVNTDILIGMLSRVIQLRLKKYEEQQRMLLSGHTISSENRIYPLKIVLMSATLRVEDFISGRRLFHTPPPVIEVPTRQYPVTVHFSKRTEVVDYIGQAYKKVLSIHKRLPKGGILVFVTGQREVEFLCQKLCKASRELTAKTAVGNVENEVTAKSEMNSIDGINMKDINEAFDSQGNASDQQTNWYSSYDEDTQVLNEDESDVSYDSETESELEFDSEGRDSSNKRSLGNGCDVLGEDGSLSSLKAAFEALVGKNTPDFNSEGKQFPIMPVEQLEDNHSLEGEEGGGKGLSPGALCVLPLYAMLPAAAQLRVFEEVEEGKRLVVVATNVAETSLTIPGIKYVVDTGREKVKKYDSSSGMETYEVQWISKASAAQRAGRAGRTGPGHCYRLYSSAAFNNILPDFSCAEISKVPVDSIVLVLKSMSIDKVENFPFPTPPDASALVEAERSLKTLEALDSNGRLTTLGKAMAHYPMSPRHSRMLLTVVQILSQVENYSRANLVLGYAVAAAAALSLSNPFLLQYEGSHTNSDGLEQSQTQDTQKILDKEEKLKEKKLKESAKLSRARFCNPSSDTLTIAYALQCFELSKNPVEFCVENALHLKTMEEMSKLRKQLLQLVFSQNAIYGMEKDFSWTHGTMGDVEQAWRVSSSKCSLLVNEEELLGQAICAGWADRVAKRIRGNLGLSEVDRKVHAVRYQACMVKEVVFLHRWSSLASSAPEFLVYSELLHTKRPYMHGATSVKPEWLVKYAGSLCTFSSVDDPKPYYEPQADQVFCWVIPTFGPHLWQLPLHSVPINNDMDRMKVFACALLEGRVLPCLKSFQDCMKARPSIILDRGALGDRRVGNLLFRLKTRCIDNCAKLREVWKENHGELKSEILAWFKEDNKESFCKDFQALWSMMQAEAHLDPQERFPKRMKRNKRKKGNAFELGWR